MRQGSMGGCGRGWLVNKGWERSSYTDPGPGSIEHWCSARSCSSSPCGCVLE